MAFSDSLRRLSASVLGLLSNRLELAALELEEEWQQFLAVLLAALAALFFLGMACTLLVVLVLVLSWENHRVLAICVMAGLFGALGLRIALVALANYRSRPRLFSATMGELQKDLQGLRGQPETAQEKQHGG
ncbi:phage holin family protein [Massilia sp. W12]|uniref:phage holin family protein n=1 Tax=Massilia sp. W12 TaxID=3126507 RepID=UPI0030D00789